VLHGTTDAVLNHIKNTYEKEHGVVAKMVDFTKHGGPRGLMFGQKQGKRLFKMKIVAADLSDRATGNIKRRIRVEVPVPAPKKQKVLIDKYKEPVEEFTITGDTIKLSDTNMVKMKYLHNDPRFKSLQVGESLTVSTKDRGVLIKLGIITASVYEELSLSGTVNFHKYSASMVSNWAKGMNTLYTSKGKRIVIPSYGDGGFYFITASRSNNALEYMKKISTKIVPRVYASQAFIDTLDRFLLNDKMKIMGTIMIHEFTAKSRHANAFIINKVTKTATRFEPHGSTSPMYNGPLCDNNMRQMIESFPRLHGFKYLSPGDYDIVVGVQTQDSHHRDFKLFPVVKGEVGGFCTPWSMYIIQIYIKNDGRFTVGEILKKMGYNPNVLAKLIREYVSYLVKTYGG
jgi:hypothetical protein